MCRLFAYLGSEPQELRPHFLDGNNALLRQATRNQDGWGVVFYQPDGSRTRVQDKESAHKSAKFFEVARNTAANCVIAHVRMATVGLVVPENTHPFVRGQWVFAHNGVIFRFAKFKQQLESQLSPHIRAGIQGETDSEYLFALFLHTLEQITEPATASDQSDVVANALRQAITKINDLALAHGASGDCLINVLLTDGRQIWGTRFGKPLVYAISPHRQGIVIATERTSRDYRWRSFPQNSLFRASATGENLMISPLLARTAHFGKVSKAHLAQGLI